MIVFKIFFCIVKQDTTVHYVFLMGSALVLMGGELSSGTNAEYGLCYIIMPFTVADSDPQLRKGMGRGVVFLALLSFLPSVISSFLTQNKGGRGWGRVPGPSPRSATTLIAVYNLQIVILCDC